MSTNPKTIGRCDLSEFCQSTDEAVSPVTSTWAPVPSNAVGIRSPRSADRASFDWSFSPLPASGRETDSTVAVVDPDGGSPHGDAVGPRLRGDLGDCAADRRRPHVIGLNDEHCRRMLRRVELLDFSYVWMVEKPSGNRSPQWSSRSSRTPGSPAPAGHLRSGRSPRPGGASPPARWRSTPASCYPAGAAGKERNSPLLHPIPEQGHHRRQNVNEPSIAIATTINVPIPNEMKTLLPLRNIPAIAAITVRPETSTARPEVAAAASIASRGPRPRARSSRSRRQ